MERRLERGEGEEGKRGKIKKATNSKTQKDRRIAVVQFAEETGH